MGVDDLGPLHSEFTDLRARLQAASEGGATLGELLDIWQEMQAIKATMFHICCKEAQS